MTLEKIRTRLPTHIMLTPGVHRWREGDDMRVGGKWFPIEYETDGEWYGEPVKIEGRRPIPPHILDNQAFWIWCKGKHMEAGLSNFEIEEIGGADVWHKQQRADCFYDKWLLEQMEDV